MVAAAAAFTFLFQNFAWAICADGTTFPADGFVAGQRPAVNWSPGVFTAAAGSIFVPDASVFQHNDPAQPLTGGGHNWVFDQFTTLCKATDSGPAGGTPSAWQIPPNSPANCLFLPFIRAGRVVSVGDIPYQGATITPTCDPTLLSQAGAPNPANTRLNQLGCSISHGVATTPQSATTFLFVAGVKSGLFAVPLVNVANPVRGGDAGKIIGVQYGVGIPLTNYYSGIPEGQRLTNGAVSPDGLFAMATSARRLRPVYACLNPLGDPGDPSEPIDPHFSVPAASQVKCMVVGNNNLTIDFTTAFGPDNQPYFGGQPGMNSFNGDPGWSATAWPQCIFNGFVFANSPPTTLTGKLQAVFNINSPHRCGNAQPNAGFSSATVGQPQAIISHGPYMYASPMGGAVLQFKVTVDPISGLSQYAFRTYVTGLQPLVTGLGVADDLQSLVVFSVLDPSKLGLSGSPQNEITKLPLCEDM
jgi:hypothetical protein